MTDKSSEILIDFPILHTKRSDLLEIKQSHLSDLFELFGDKNVTEFYNTKTLTEEKEAQKYLDWFRSRFHDKLGIRWGIALKGYENIIGTIGFNNFTKGHRANLGYDLRKDYWNNGFIKEALNEVIKYGFEDLEINRIEAEVMPGNIYSEMALSKLGFKKEGLLRDWMLWNEKHYDMIMYSLLRKEIETTKS
jgi:ribosomal-protein-alanine N-acetyltransferase